MNLADDYCRYGSFCLSHPLNIQWLQFRLTACLFYLLKSVTFSLSSIYSCGGTAIIYFIRTDLGKIKQASLKCSDEIRNLIWSFSICYSASCRLE